MKSVDAFERDYSAALIAILEGIPLEELFKPIQPGVPFSASEPMKSHYRKYADVERQAINYRDKLKKMEARYPEELDEQVASMRRVGNILKVNENFNTRQDLLNGVDLVVSPGLKALEQYRHIAVEGGTSSPEEEPVSLVAGNGQATRIPTKGEIQRYKAAGATNKQIAERYADFFGFDKSSSDKSHWETVYGRLKAFMRDKYKGNRRH